MVINVEHFRKISCFCKLEIKLILISGKTCKFHVMYVKEELFILGKHIWFSTRFGKAYDVGQNVHFIRLSKQSGKINVHLSFVQLWSNDP